MSIYRLKSDIKNCMMFTVDDLDVYDKMEDFDIENFGQVLEYEWRAPKAYFMEPNSGATTKPDITHWNATNLTVSQKARKGLEPSLKENGELLSLTGDAEDYTLFNPTKRMGNEIINVAKCVSVYFDSGALDYVEKLVFKEDAGQHVPELFTIEYDGGATLYCNEVFKGKVLKLGLSGLIFESME